MASSRLAVCHALSNAVVWQHHQAERKVRNRPCTGGLSMTWKTPKIVEIALGAEINCYACAELPD